MTITIPTTLDREELLNNLEVVRSTTESLCEPLATEDMVVQTMPDVSPTKWHLAHTTWFFETLVLSRSGRKYSLFDERFPALFNSYYRSLGDPYPRARRGLLSRPTVDEIKAYRRHVDEALAAVLKNGSNEVIEAISSALTIGMHHEQQHQELMLMDVKHVLARNPLRPSYRFKDGRPEAADEIVPARPREWRSFEGGRVEVGSAGGDFAFDNELPRHTVLLEPFQLAARPVTAGEYRAFMADGGYSRPELWLADGWDLAQREGWRAPLYWEEHGSDWRVMTLGGLREVDPLEPVCHVSYYEADAFAAWAGHRLPTEFEWERASQEQTITGTFLESGAYHPRALRSTPDDGALAQLFGDVWEWTSSPYVPYPGYEPFKGALGEYNGKFMINQVVLRGGCCVTPKSHLRRTYRNFYYPHQRWMFAGLRLAK